MIPQLVKIAAITAAIATLLIVLAGLIVGLVLGSEDEERKADKDV